MVTPGSQVGRANEQQQGTGRATILQGDRAQDTFDRLAFEQRQVKRAEEAQKKADLNAAYDRMVKFNPERWYKHENQVRSALNDWYNQGTKMMAGGIDPWKSTDAAALAWRKDQLRVMGLAQASKQLQDRFTALRGKIDGAEPDKYTSTSLNNIADFFDTDLQKVVDEGLVPPDLMQRKPFLNLQDTFSKVMQPINQKKNGEPLTDSELWDVAKTTVADPENGDELADSFRSALAQMDPEDQADIKRRAQAKGVSIPQQMAYDYASRYAQDRKPFNYNDWMKVALDRVEVPYREWKGPESFSKKVDKQELNRITEAVARNMFVADDRALQEYEQVLPRGSEDDGTYRKKAIAHLAQSLRDQTATQEMAGQTSEGKSNAELASSRIKWLDAMMSPDPEKYREAAGYLFQTGDVMGNMTVAESRVLPPAENKTTMTDVPVLSLMLKGNLSLKDVETQLPSGLPGESTVEQRGTETEVQIPITNATENYLLAMHDKAFEQKKKAPFAGTFRETPKRKLSDIIGGGSKPAPEKTSTPKKFSF